MNIRRSTRAFVFVLVGVSGFATACKGGSNSANSPTSPSNVSNVQGGWTGTLTRPNGLGILILQWSAQVATDSSGVDHLKGPITLTGAGGFTAEVADAIPAGNDSRGYTIYMSFSEAAPPSSCKIIGGAVNQTGEPFPAPYNTITIASFNMSVAGDCRGVLDGGTEHTNLNEVVQLSLRKQ